MQSIIVGSRTARIIITGAPGTGKSTILKGLAAKGYPVLPEMARQLIAEQQALDSDLLPWKDHLSFGAELFKRQKQQYAEALEGQRNFYDRGIPDNLGYLRRDKLRNTLWEAEARNYPYHHQVFLCPPWEEIYGKDAVRWEELDLMLEIHQALEGIYQDFGYQVIEVPKISPQERINFILNTLVFE